MFHVVIEIPLNICIPQSLFLQNPTLPNLSMYSAHLMLPVCHGIPMPCLKHFNYIITGLIPISLYFNPHIQFQLALSPLATSLYTWTGQLMVFSMASNII